MMVSTLLYTVIAFPPPEISVLTCDLLLELVHCVAVHLRELL